MRDVEAELSTSLSSNPSERTSQLTRLIDYCVDVEDVDSLALILDRTDESVARNVLNHFAIAVRRMPAPSLETAAQHALGKTHAYEEADKVLRNALFDVLVSQGCFREAAVVLTRLHPKSDLDKAATYVKIAETFLEDDESVDAETYVSRASGLMHAVPQDDWALQLRYRVTLARTLDARRKFLDAAMHYYELSQANHDRVAAEDLVALLSKSVTCAVLGNAGPQRSRILAMLYEDARVTSHMEPSPDYAPHAIVLKKMCTGQLVTKAELSKFEATLLPHQRATTADGLTIPDKATVQHNLVAVSQLYDNISLVQLGTLLEIDPVKAEQVASRMITDGRLPGASLDQVDADIFFSPPISTTQAKDVKLYNICAQVNSCYEKIEDLALS